jgi:hypothetical protein
MWKRIFWIVILLTLIGSQQVMAQEDQALQMNPQGMLLEPLRDGNTILCVIHTNNEGPQWFLLSSTGWNLNERIGSLSSAKGLITVLKASPNGKFLAVLSVAEGHPRLEIIDLKQLLSEKTYTVLQEINPYPGTIEILSWEGDLLQVSSDMLLTQMDKTSKQVPSELSLSWSETFSLNAITGVISGISEGAKNPAEHYSKTLMDPQATDAEKDLALSKLVTMQSEQLSVPYLLEVLDQEQDPKRINKLLDEIAKLRSK